MAAPRLELFCDVEEYLSYFEPEVTESHSDDLGQNEKGNIQFFPRLSEDVDSPYHHKSHSNDSSHYQCCDDQPVLEGFAVARLDKFPSVLDECVHNANLLSNLDIAEYNYIIPFFVV